MVPSKTLTMPVAYVAGTWLVPVAGTVRDFAAVVILTVRAPIGLRVESVEFGVTSKG